MKTTFMANAGNITRKWYIVDAAGLTVGRLAASVAKVLTGKNTGNQSGCRAAVSAVQYLFRCLQTVKTVSVNKNRAAGIFNLNPHFFKTGNGGKTVSTLQKSGDFSRSPGNGSEHDTSVGYGFVSGNGYSSL